MKRYIVIKMTLFTVSILPLLSQAQTCNPNIPATTPTSRFEVLNNGSEVKDKKTGLIWQRCSLGQIWDGNTCTGTPETYTWREALKQTKNLNNNYRLPNIKELFSIVEYQCHRPAINLTIFPNIIESANPNYWSSTPSISPLHKSVHGVAFGSGTSFNNPANSKRYARAVRSE